MSALWQQYKQSIGDFQRGMPAIVLDTLTTRFFFLILFAMLIPLLTVNIFTGRLLATQLNENADNQLRLSRDMLNLRLQESRPLPALSTPRKTAKEISRLDTGIDVMRSAIPDRFGQAQTSPLVHLDSALLGMLFYQQESLKTQIWIVSDPLPEPTHPHWLARASASARFIPSATLFTALQKAEITTQEMISTLNLQGEDFKILAVPLFSATHQRIAWVIHILPMRAMQNVLSQFYTGIYSISVASVLFSVLLALLAGRSITQPLLRLIQQVNALSRSSVGQGKLLPISSAVSEIRLLSESFSRMLQRLAQEHTMKDEFVATLTHDLKVPMLAEKQTLQYFSKHVYGPLNEEQQEVISLMQSANQSCLSLINGLLEVYRYDSGRARLLLESFSIQTLLEETVGELQSLALEKSLTVRIQSNLKQTTAPPKPSLYGTFSPDTEANEVAVVYADRLEMKRVLHNLVSNAITNSPAHGGEIICLLSDSAGLGASVLSSVSTFQASTLTRPIDIDDHLLVSIQDSGVGFSTDDLSHLFKQFAATRGRNPMSTGLGLYNCFQVIQAHHGMLWVESTEGEGSAVCFVVARTPAQSRERSVYRERRKN